MVGAYPTETEELLGALRGLSALRIQNDTAAVKMAPMHCLASLPLLQVPRPLITTSVASFPVHRSLMMPRMLCSP